MQIINLRDFYPWYKHDELVEVPDAIAAELLADKRYHKAHRRRVYRNKAQYSLDCEDGIESEACFLNLTSHEIFERLLLRCEVCKALNSLPELQGRRIEAHYLTGISKVDIARAEGVAEKNVRQSIERGLQTIREHLKNYF